MSRAADRRTQIRIRLFRGCTLRLLRSPRRLLLELLWDQSEASGARRRMIEVSHP